MPPEHDYRDEDIAALAGDEPIGNAQAPRLAASDVPEDGAPDGAPAGASAPRSLRAGPPAADADQSAETPPEGESPLITAVEIENFKGIGRPVRIELRPITLLSAATAPARAPCCTPSATRTRS